MMLALKSYQESLNSSPKLEENSVRKMSNYQETIYINQVNSLNKEILNSLWMLL